MKLKIKKDLGKFYISEDIGFKGKYLDRKSGKLEHNCLNGWFCTELEAAQFLVDYLQGNLKIPEVPKLTIEERLARIENKLGIN